VADRQADEARPVRWCFWALARFQCPYPPRSSPIQPYFDRLARIVTWATFAGVEPQTASLRFQRRRASHTRGRRFETRRAHQGTPCKVAGFLLAGDRLSPEPASGFGQQCPISAYSDLENGVIRPSEAGMRGSGERAMGAAPEAADAAAQFGDASLSFTAPRLCLCLSPAAVTEVHNAHE
jgi:hypothetical protein